MSAVDSSGAYRVTFDINVSEFFADAYQSLTGGVSRLTNCLFPTEQQTAPNVAVAPVDPDGRRLSHLTINHLTNEGDTGDSSVSDEGESTVVERIVYPDKSFSILYANDKLVRHHADGSYSEWDKEGKATHYDRRGNIMLARNIEAQSSTSVLCRGLFCIALGVAGIVVGVLTWHPGYIIAGVVLLLLGISRVIWALCSEGSAARSVLGASGGSLIDAGWILFIIGITTGNDFAILLADVL